MGKMNSLLILFMLSVSYINTYENLNSENSELEELMGNNAITNNDDTELSKFYEKESKNYKNYNIENYKTPNNNMYYENNNNNNVENYNTYNTNNNNSNEQKTEEIKLLEKNQRKIP